MSSDKTVTVVNDGGLRNYGGFGWVAGRDDEVFVTYQGTVQGSCDQMSLYQAEATGMQYALHLMKCVMQELIAQVCFSIWSDNSALIRRMSKMIEFDPVAAYLKSDPDLYCGIRNVAGKLWIEEIGHFKGHQDQAGRILSNIEKFNVIADKLTIRAVYEENSEEPEWNPLFGTMLKIAGKTITRKEGLQSVIAAEVSDLHEWQRRALNKTRVEYKKIDWTTQHATIAKLPSKTH